MTHRSPAKSLPARRPQRWCVFADLTHPTDRPSSRIGLWFAEREYSAGVRIRTPAISWRSYRPKCSQSPVRVRGWRRVPKGSGVGAVLVPVLLHSSRPPQCNDLDSARETPRRTPPVQSCQGPGGWRRSRRRRPRRTGFGPGASLRSAPATQASFPIMRYNESRWSSARSLQSEQELLRMLRRGGESRCAFLDGVARRQKLHFIQPPEPLQGRTRPPGRGGVRHWRQGRPGPRIRPRGACSAGSPPGPDPSRGPRPQPRRNRRHRRCWTGETGPCVRSYRPRLAGPEPA
jgi:hypothetical protein